MRIELKHFLFFLWMISSSLAVAQDPPAESQAPTEIENVREEQKVLIENYQKKKKEIEARLQQEVARTTVTEEESQAQEEKIRSIRADLQELKETFQENLRVLRDKEREVLGAPSQKIEDTPRIMIYQPPVPSATPAPAEAKVSQGLQQIQSLKQHLQTLNQEVQQLENLLKELENAKPQ